MSSQPSWTELNRRVEACDRCPRLREYCADVAARKRRAYRGWDYWGRPVPNFGDPQAKMLIVGLAPAAHGANRTGRMFTGDRSGQWLYRALHKSGLANQASFEDARDGLQLNRCAITAVCHCAPPGNRPSPDEQRQCREWLQATFDLLRPRLYLALGKIAWDAVADEAKHRGWIEGPRPKFAHAARRPLAEHGWLLGSYHPSQQNTQTGRLTERMLDDVLNLAVEMLQQ